MPAIRGQIVSAGPRLDFCGRADVAELVDAHGSGPCGRKLVEVQVLSSAYRPRRSCADAQDERARTTEAGVSGRFRQGCWARMTASRAFGSRHATDMPARFPGRAMHPARAMLVISLLHHLHEAHHVVPAAAVERVSTDERKVWLRLTRAEVEQAPEHHDPPAPLDSSLIDSWSSATSRFGNPPR